MSTSNSPVRTAEEGLRDTELRMTRRRSDVARALEMLLGVKRDIDALAQRGLEDIQVQKESVSNHLLILRVLIDWLTRSTRRISWSASPT
jgi:hypothetical protein